MEKAQNFSFSGGLVEIAALTALIGGSTAESLTLGNRGACGLPWAALSSFGSIFIIKACISACTPAWLRETIGVRTRGSDNAVGCSMRLNRNANNRGMTGDAVGVITELDKDGDGPSSVKVDPNSFENVYAFDEWTGGPLRSCTAMQLGEHLQAHIYMRDQYWTPLHRTQVKTDWVLTFATGLKAIEMYLLFYFGSVYICWLTGLMWAYFLLASVILQIFRVGRASPSVKQNRCLDIVAGSLPTAQVVGGERKVLFDVPINPRKSALWQVCWAIGSVVCVCSLFGTYALLSKEPETCFRIWVFFQILWLALRSIFFHFAQPMDDFKHVITTAVTEKRRPAEVSFRLLSLAAALSKYQVLNHPRGAHSYAEDAQDPVILKKYFDDADFEISERLPLPQLPNPGSDVEITVAAVLGDTLLSSVAWLMGSTLTGMELYDSCILVIRSSNKTLLVPACRVLSGRLINEQEPDPESTLPSPFVPKGASNDGKDISWRYWIPCGGGTWVLYSTPWATVKKADLSVVGTKTMRVTTEDSVTNELREGTLMVSMNSVKDVEASVEQSTKVAMMMNDMMLGKWTVRKDSMGF